MTDDDHLTDAAVMVIDEKRPTISFVKRDYAVTWQKDWIAKVARDLRDFTLNAKDRRKLVEGLQLLHHHLEEDYLAFEDRDESLD